ncbi:hypothetical protein GIB67_003664 [Kingdonia uniflora]|uniref:Aminotransferase-like plant mobile domain-containing protein n=1 Tax=Kingdonia uniflora TaxID=39325 RepID=A0A7J7M3U3_9MAGN|nr:hypothetical protein GIB67_003664 [Kingdonia uniflora]
MPLTASNRRKRELAREGDLVTYKRKRKTIDPSTVVPPNTVDSANEDINEPLPPAESAQGMNIPQSLEFETKSAQTTLGAQPTLINVFPDFDVTIPIIRGYSEGEGATSNDDVGPSDKSLLRNFWFHRARSIALGQSKTNSFYFKWGEMTSTLDDVEQLVGLPADGDVMVIGGTWGFLAILEVFENNLLQDLNAFKSLKAEGTWNLLLLRKLKEYYAYKLGKVLSDSTVLATKKKKGLTTRSVARAYMLYIPRSFLFPTKKGIDVSARYLYLFSKEKVCKKIESLKVVNALLMEQIDLQLLPATPLAVLQSHQPVPDTTLTKKYEGLLAVHEDVKKKLITKDDFGQKLVNAKERIKSLEANNREWDLLQEVWRQALMKALTSEGMGDMRDPTFEEFFKQNERFFAIAQQVPKGDYQQDLVFTAVTLKNVVIARREKMAKKKKIQKLLYQPWTKYLVDVRGIEISDNNFGIRVISAI